MDILVGMLGLLGMPVCLLILLIQLFRKKSKKKPAIAFVICLVMFIGGGVWSANKPESTETVKEETLVKTNYKRLDKYEWGSAAKDVFEQIGVETVKSVEVRADEETGTIYDVYVETERGKISVMPVKNIDGWEILWVSNNTVYESLAYGDDFYVTDSLKYDEEGRLIRDIYSFRTGELAEAKSEEAIADAEKEKEEELKIPGNSSPYPIVVTMDDFVSEIKQDKFAAGLKYDDKWIQITGTVSAIVDGGDMYGYYIYGGRYDEGLKIICWVYGDEKVASIADTVTFKGLVREITTVNVTEITYCTVVEEIK